MRFCSLFLCSVCIVLFLLVSCRDLLIPDSDTPEAVTVPILMFHDLKTCEGGTWSISEEKFRDILQYLLDNGYTPVFLEDLVKFMDGEAALPSKPVVITLDDGYYSNYSIALPIITELCVPVTIFLCCGLVRADGVQPNTDAYILSKMSREELTIMQASPYVQIQSHTYALHGENYSCSTTARDNILPLADEDADTYKAVFSSDCILAESVLNRIGVKTQTAFSYPSGKHHVWAEEVLQERGYRISVTTDTGHRNRIIRGDSDSLRLLGRMNVNDSTTPEALQLYLEGH